MLVCIAAQHPAALGLRTVVTRREETLTCLEETIDLSQPTFYFLSEALASDC